MSQEREAVVQVREFDWAEMVRKAWGKDWAKPDVAYEFTGRKLNEPAQGGPYAETFED